VKPCQINDREKLAAYFRQDLPLHVYSLGDLDDLHWPRTTCFGLVVGEEISHVTTLYQGEGLPVLLAFGTDGFIGENYYHWLSNRLPDPFYAHLSPGVEETFKADHVITDYGTHYKMSLVEPRVRQEASQGKAHRLDISHLPELRDLYQQSYTENAFDPAMLTTGKYYGCRSKGMLISAAGVHVYSSRYRVAAIGNITTHPDHRNRGFARLVTSALCRDLLDEVNHIGLNVKADNEPALHLYQSLGFEISCKYGEFSLKKRI